MIDPVLQDIFAKFGGLIGLPRLSLDGGGRCSLLIGDTQTLDFMFDTGHDALVVYADLGGIEPHRAKELYPLFLEANLLWGGTSGATLSVSDDAPPRTILAQPFAWRESSAEMLHEIVEEFLKTTNLWREVIQDLPAESPAAAPRQLSDMEIAMMRA